MKNVYFGPEKNVPSWYWVGKDIAENFPRQINVKYFKKIEEINNDSIVFWIKNPLSSEKVNFVRNKNLKVVYFPIDTYNNEAEIKRDQEFIGKCKLIVLHSENMKDFFNKSNIKYVDHYNKFGINGNLRKPNGEFLWIGGYQYFPYIYQYLLESKNKLQINILSDYKCESAVKAANKLSEKLKLNIDFSNIHNFKDLKIFEWNESKQKELLLSCEGAFDYKHVDEFNQKYKPPTKIQKYISSFIPTAVNKQSFSYSYMKRVGLDMCDLTQIDILKSKKYKDEIRKFGESISCSLTKEAITKKYMEFLEWVE